MSKKFDHIDASEAVSTVTKHIKIYSDNPIHDCIDRIIESSVMLDSVNSDKEYCLALLHEAANDLFSEVCMRLYDLGGKQRKEDYAKKPN
jgi:hypothetical protein